MRAVEAGISIGANGGILVHAYRRDRHSGAGNCVCGRHEGHQIHIADAEQAKSTGGMAALLPRRDDAHHLVVRQGEPLDDLHLTLVYLGEDVTSIPGGDLPPALASVADQFPALDARVFGHAIFNPDGFKDRDPALVYLVGDSEDLSALQQATERACCDVFPLPEQHKPFIPHITAGYNLPPDCLNFTGGIVFDRMVLEFAGETTTFPLITM